MCLVDGDPQQHANLVEALQTYLCNAVHTTCGYHLVMNSWKRYCPPKVSIQKSMLSKFEEFGKHITNWLFSFMRPGYCETQAEYELSKSLLYAFIRSPEVQKILCSSQNVNQIDDWVRNIVLTKENQFLYYQRKHLRYYYQMTTSPHEGTNYGMKSHAARVRPSHTMLKSGRALSLQSTLKMGQLRHESTAAMCSNSLWANEWTSKHLTVKAESIIQQTLEKLKNYTVNRTSETTWQTFYMKTSENNNNTEEVAQNDTENTNGNNTEKWSPIPVFNRNRIVKLDDNKSLRCSCFKFESTGLPCHHIGAVIKHHYPDWKGFSHHDCGLEWWKIWHHYAYNPKARGVANLLSKAKSLPITGASFPTENRNPPDVTAEFDAMVHTPIENSIRNYDAEKIESVLRNKSWLEGSITTQYEGLSQSSNILPDDGDDGFIGSTDEDNTIQNQASRDNLVMDRLFAPMLQPDNQPMVGTAFELLKHNFFEMLNVLDTHRKELPEKDKCNEIMTLLQAQTNAMRKDLLEESKKRPTTDNEIINIMSEARPRSVKRKYNSKNC